MNGRKSILSDKSKNKIADEMGIKHKVEKDGWGEVSSKNCGNIVKNVVEKLIEETTNEKSD